VRPKAHLQIPSNCSVQVFKEFENKQKRIALQKSRDKIWLQIFDWSREVSNKRRGAGFQRI